MAFICHVLPISLIGAVVSFTLSWGGFLGGWYAGLIGAGVSVGLLARMPID